MNNFVQFVQRLKFQLRWKLLGGFLLSNVLLLVGLLLALLFIFGSQQTLSQVKDSKERLLVLNEIENKQAIMLLDIVDYAWSGNLLKLSEYDSSKKEILASLERFQPSTGEQQADFDKLKVEFTKLTTTLDEIISLNQSNRVQAAQIIWRQNGSDQKNASLAQFENLVRGEDERTDIQYEHIVAGSNIITWLITGVVVLAVLFAVGLAFVLTTALIRPLANLKERLADLARGDLTQTTDIHNRDELGELGRTFNESLIALRGMVNQVHNQSQRVGSATQVLSEQTTQYVGGSREQASSVIEVTHTLQILEQTARNIASQTVENNESVEYSLQQARAVSQAALEMVQSGEQGRKRVAQTVEAIHKLKEQVGTIATNHALLLEQSAVIDGVISLIDDIGHETHLLALNAAIEAAGAGEHGVRFAVIAQEIKRLSDRSVQATKQVRGSLEGLAESVQRVNQSVIAGSQEVEKAVADANQSDQALLNLVSLSEQVKSAASDIVSYIEGSVNLALSIEVATQAQQNASKQILETMQAIESVALLTLDRVKDGESATYELRQSARELQGSADAFRLIAR